MPEEDGISENKVFCGCWGMCDPRKPMYRYVILLIACLLCIGSNYCDDTSGALQHAITNDMNVSTSQFSKLYSSYAYPNVILCFVGGFLIDRVFGIRGGGIIFSFLVLIGQNMIGLGALLKRFWIMEFGNVIFGAGTQTLNVISYMYIVNWFKGKELNMALSLESSVTFVVAALNLAFTPAIYFLIPETYSGHTRLGITIFIIAVPCIMSHISSYILAFCDQRAIKILNKAPETKDEVARLSDIKDFPVTFWLIVAMTMTHYSVFYTFIGLGKVFFACRYRMNDISGMNSANTIDSAFYIISAIVSPILGIILDKTGRNIVWLFVAIILTLFSFLGLGFTNINPWIPVVIIGFWYPVVFSNAYTLIALEVPEHQLGTAYGILVSGNNLAFAIVTMAGGFIIEAKGFVFLMLLFIDLLCVSLIACMFLFGANASRGGILNMAVRERIDRMLEIMNANQRESERRLSFESMAGHGSCDSFYSDTE